MSRKYFAFDIETAKIVPEPASDWRLHRPLPAGSVRGSHPDVPEQAELLWAERTTT